MRYERCLNNQAFIPCFALADGDKKIGQVSFQTHLQYFIPFIFPPHDHRNVERACAVLDLAVQWCMCLNDFVIYAKKWTKPALQYTLSRLRISTFLQWLEEFAQGHQPLFMLCHVMAYYDMIFCDGIKETIHL